MPATPVLAQVRHSLNENLRMAIAKGDVSRDTKPGNIASTPVGKGPEREYYFVDERQVRMPGIASVHATPTICD